MKYDAAVFLAIKIFWRYISEIIPHVTNYYGICKKREANGQIASYEKIIKNRVEKNANDNKHYFLATFLDPKYKTFFFDF